MTLEERLKEIEARANTATEGPWVWGDWTIFDKDRESQKRKEPYWTLITNGGSLVRGPLGRKSLEPDSIAKGMGYDESDIDITLDDAEFIAHARTDVPALIRMLRLAIEQLKIIKEFIMEQDDNTWTVTEAEIVQIVQKTIERHLLKAWEGK